MTFQDFQEFQDPGFIPLEICCVQWPKAAPPSSCRKKVCSFYFSTWGGGDRSPNETLQTSKWDFVELRAGLGEFFESSDLQGLTIKRSACVIWSKSALQQNKAINIPPTLICSYIDFSGLSCVNLNVFLKKRKYSCSYKVWELLWLSWFLLFLYIYLHILYIL